jgi:hypothetical protein
MAEISKASRDRSVIPNHLSDFALAEWSSACPCLGHDSSYVGIRSVHSESKSFSFLLRILRVPLKSPQFCLGVFTPLYPGFLFSALGIRTERMSWPPYTPRVITSAEEESFIALLVLPGKKWMRFFVCCPGNARSNEEKRQEQRCCFEDNYPQVSGATVRLIFPSDYGL